MTRPDRLTARVKALALAAGFARVGIAAAVPAADGEAFRRWLAAGAHGSMSYLARNVEKRLRPDRLVPGARSVICLAVGCAPQGPPESPFVARYARGRDYHKVLKRRCRTLMGRIRRIAPAFEGRAFVDSAPVLERSLARAAGLGWIGRNRCLVAGGLGSYVLLCEIITNLPLRADAPADGQCGDCGACVAACPTGALSNDGFDARRCISYLTVEHRGPIAPELRPLMGRRLIGCDACQEACPHNRDVPPGDAELRSPTPPLSGAGPAEVLAWTEADWDHATRGTAARRASLPMLLRNAVIAAGNSAGTADQRELVARLRRLRPHRPELDELIAWAIARLAGG